jgi:hypothetical protein
MKDKEYIEKLFSKAKNIINEVISGNKNIYKLRFSRDFNQLIKDRVKKYY